jgi:LuxR family transcriptional regulator
MEQPITPAVFPLTASLTFFAAGLERAADFAGAMDVLFGAARGLGFEGVDYSYVSACRSADGAWTPPPVETRAFPSGWDRHWDRFSADDPYYHACLEGTDWIDWSEVQARPQLSVRERLSLAYLEDHGITRGLTIPIRVGRGLAFVSGLGPPSLGLEGAARQLFALAHYFHGRVRRHSRLREHQPARLLSPRELECLTWAARGKTAEDCAVILGRSPETVRIHLKHAIRKMNAANTTHAVAKAILLELIEP